MIERILSEQVQAFIVEHEADDIHKLALSLKPIDDVSVTELLAQINGRKKAKEKLPEWYSCSGIYWPAPLSIEQCSSETAAKYKASLLSAHTMADLTGGAGVDTYYLSKSFKRADYIERDARLCEVAQHNHKVLGANNIHHHQTEATAYLQQMAPVDMIYLDPARRDENKHRVFLLENCEPNVVSLLPLLLEKADQVIIKTSPILDIRTTLDRLKNVLAVHIVGVNNDCKEVLYILGKRPMTSPDFYTVNFTRNSSQRFHFNLHTEGMAATTYSEVLQYLYEPNAAIMKAGAFRSIGAAFGLNKLHANTHLYTSDELQEDFPGRTFRVKHVLRVDKKSLLALLPEKKANVSTRNFPMKPESLKKKFGLLDGGDIYLFGFTDYQEAKKIALTEKIS